MTNVSGRGVGMDVVRREVEALRGNIQIKSEQGQGTSIELMLPLTLAIIDGLVVDVGGTRFVLPLSAVEECMELSPANLAFHESRHLLNIRGSLVPFVRLRDLFGIQNGESAVEHVAIVQSNEERFGVVCDRIVGDHQTVIKSLGDVYKDTEGVSGATIMGDGTVALIVDVGGLLRCVDMGG